MMCNKLGENDIKINLPLSDFVLTPLACASLVNEIIISLLYEKSQIPYTYNWLKNIVSRKGRTGECEGDTLTKNFTAKKYYNVVSSAYNDLENLMDSINKELKSKSNVISEFLIIFGVTPLSPKQTFSIKLSNVLHDHNEANHVHSNLKQKQNLLRKLFLSEDWFKAIKVSLPVTNMYIMLKKTYDASFNDNFIINKSFQLPRNCVQIRLECDNKQKLSCCSNLLIYDDKTNSEEVTVFENKKDDVNEANLNDGGIWFQAKTVFKGYKDCYINKVHASELW